MKFYGKRALITGGTHGIGKAIAVNLVQRGCSVAVFSRTEKRVNETQNILNLIGQDNICLVADVLNEDSYDYIRDQITKKWSGIDIVINNIGGGGRWGSSDILKTDNEVWKQVYDKNLTASMRYTKMFLPHMIKNKWGRVVTITSMYGNQIGGRPWFNIAKTAQTVLMKNLSKNKLYSSSNITFNCVAPGAIDIPDTGWDTMKVKNPEMYKNYIDQNIPRGKLGTPQEVANVVLFLCSEFSGLVNGACISCDGGQGHV